MHEQRNLFIAVRGGRGCTHPSGDMSDRDRGFLRPSTNYNRFRYARRTLAHGRVIKPFLYYTERERSLPSPLPLPPLPFTFSSLARDTNYRPWHLNK